MQPYMVPGQRPGAPQHAYMIPHPGAIQQPYQAPGYNPSQGMYHMPVHMQPVMMQQQQQMPSTMQQQQQMPTQQQPQMPSTLGPASQLHRYNVDQCGDTLQKSVYTSSWTSSSTHPPNIMRPGYPPPGGAPSLGQWTMSPPPPLGSAPVMGQSWSMTTPSQPMLSTVQPPTSPVRITYVSSTQSYSPTKLYQLPQQPKPLDHLSPCSSSSTRHSQNNTDLNSDRHISESTSCASSVASSPVKCRSRSSSIVSRSSVISGEHKTLGPSPCASPPIALHPYASISSMSSLASKASDDPVEDRTEEGATNQTDFIDKLFQSRASIHGIEISAAPPGYIEKKNKKTTAVYHEKVKADRFMEIALKRGIIVSTDTGKQDVCQESDEVSSELNSIESSGISSIMADIEDRQTSNGAETPGSSRSRSISESSSQNSEGVLGQFSSRFAKRVIEDACAELASELNCEFDSDSTTSSQVSSSLNAHAKEFTMTFTAPQPSLNPESPEFKPSYFRRMAAKQSSEEDSELTAASIFKRNVNSSVDIYIADPPKIEKSNVEEYLEPYEPPSMVDVAVNTRRIRVKDTSMQTPLAFEPRDVCVNTEESCCDEESEFFTKEILLKTQGTNTTQAETRSRMIQVKIEPKTHNQRVQAGEDDIRAACGNCVEKDLLIIQLQIQLCHLRAQVCIGELQRQMTELQQSKLQIISLFSSGEEEAPEVTRLIDARVEWLQDEIDNTKVTLMRNIEKLQRGQSVESLAPIGITIATSVGSNFLLPKELKFMKSPVKSESSPSRKRTHETDRFSAMSSPHRKNTLSNHGNVTIQNIDSTDIIGSAKSSPQRNGMVNSLTSPETSDRIPTQNLVQESLKELQRVRNFCSPEKSSEGHIEFTPLGVNYKAPKQPSLETIQPTNEVVPEKTYEEIVSSLVKSPAIAKAVQEKLAAKNVGSQLSQPNEKTDLSINQKIDQYYSLSSESHSSKLHEQVGLSLENKIDHYSSQSPESDEIVSHVSPSADINQEIEETSVEVQGHSFSVALDENSNVDVSLNTEKIQNAKEVSDMVGNASPSNDSQKEELTTPSKAPVKSPFNLTDEIRKSSLKSPPNPIPTLPFPLPLIGALKMTPEKKFTTSKNDDNVASVCLEQQVVKDRESPDPVKDGDKSSDTVKDVEVKCSDFVEHVEEKSSSKTEDSSETHTDSSPTKDRAPPGFEHSGDVLNDDISGELDISIDTSELVKRAKSVLENFNLDALKNKSPRKLSKPKPETDHSNTGNKDLENMEKEQPSWPLVQDEESKEETDDNETGISHLILSAKKKLSDVSKNESRKNDDQDVKDSETVSSKTEPVASMTEAVAPFQKPTTEESKGQELPQNPQIDPSVYQAVLTQVAKAYPHLTANPMMLHSVCLQQTMVLQSYMGGSQAGSTSVGNTQSQGSTPPPRAGTPPASHASMTGMMPPRAGTPPASHASMTGMMPPRAGTPPAVFLAQTPPQSLTPPVSQAPIMPGIVSSRAGTPSAGLLGPRPSLTPPAGLLGPRPPQSLTPPFGEVLMPGMMPSGARSATPPASTSAVASSSRIPPLMSINIPCPVPPLTSVGVPPVVPLYRPPFAAVPLARMPGIPPYPGTAAGPPLIMQPALGQMQARTRTPSLSGAPSSSSVMSSSLSGSTNQPSWAIPSSSTAPPTSQEGQKVKPLTSGAGQGPHAAWNPIALANTMNARKGAGDSNPKDGDNAPIKFQAANSVKPPPVITGKTSEQGCVPVGLKNFLVQGKKPDLNSVTESQTNSKNETENFEFAKPFQKVAATKSSTTSKTDLFPPVKANTVVTNEDWEFECDKYPKEFKCNVDTKAPVRFTEKNNEDAPQEIRPRSGSFGRGRRRERNSESVGSRDSSASSTRSNDSRSSDGSRGRAYTGLDDFGAKPSRPDTGFLGRVLKSSINSNNKKEKEKNDRIKKKKDEEKKKSQEDSTSEDDWQTVGMKKRKREQTRADQLPSMTSSAPVQHIPVGMAPKSGPVTPASKTARNNFDRLMDTMEKNFSFLNRTDLKEVIQQVRERRGGGLSGMKLNEITEAAAAVIQQRFRHRLPVDTSKRSTETQKAVQASLYCTTEFQKHFDKTSLSLPTLSKVSKPPEDGFEEEDVCPICFEDFHHGTKKQLDCGHEFHVPCIREWVLKHERTCPTCRRLTLFQEEFPSLS